MPFDLNRLINLLEPGPVNVQASGAREQTYVRVPTRAALMSDRGKTEVDDGVEIPTGRRRYIVRYRPDLTTAWKAEIENIYYTIRDVADIPSERRRGFLQIVMERSNERSVTIL